MSPLAYWEGARVAPRDTAPPLPVEPRNAQGTVREVSTHGIEVEWDHIPGYVTYETPQDITLLAVQP